MHYQSNRATERKSKLQPKRFGLGQDVVSTFPVAALAIAFIIAWAGATTAQPGASPQGAANQITSAATLIATGQQQLQAARSANTEEAYRVAAATFDRAVQLDATDPIARLYLGLTRMELSGWFA